MASRLMFVGLLSALSLGGCAYDDGYGYGGMSAGTGYYAGDYYGPAGYGGPDYYGGGWYNDFYYPGTGYYVFDRGGRRHRWNDGQRNYWEARRQQYRARDQAGRPNGNDGRWRDGNRGRNPERSVNRGPDGRGPRSGEERRGWRADRQANGVAPGAVTRSDRQLFRDRGRAEGRASTPRMERREASPRSYGGSPRSRGGQPRTQQP